MNLWSSVHCPSLSCILLQINQLCPSMPPLTKDPFSYYNILHLQKLPRRKERSFGSCSTSFSVKVISLWELDTIKKPTSSQRSPRIYGRISLEKVFSIKEKNARQRSLLQCPPLDSEGEVTLTSIWKQSLGYVVLHYQNHEQSVNS